MRRTRTTIELAAASAALGAAAATIATHRALGLLAAALLAAAAAVEYLAPLAPGTLALAWWWCDRRYGDKDAPEAELDFARARLLFEAAAELEEPPAGRQVRGARLGPEEYARAVRALGVWFVLIDPRVGDLDPAEARLHLRRAVVASDHLADEAATQRSLLAPAWLLLVVGFSALGPGPAAALALGAAAYGALWFHDRAWRAEAFGDRVATFGAEDGPAALATYLRRLGVAGRWDARGWRLDLLARDAPPLALRARLVYAATAEELLAADWASLVRRAEATTLA